MAFSFNSPDKSFEFTIRDFSPDAQRLLMSCLDVNGLMADPDAFKLVLFQHIQELVKDPAELELAKQIALKGQIEPLLKDESNALNFTLNSFRMNLSNIGREAKMPSLKEIQHIVKDEAWQKLREDLSWTKDNIGSSLRRLRQYMGENPSRVKQVRVLNLLNGVARGGIMTDDILRMQKRL